MQTDIYARLRDLASSADSKPAEMRPVLLRVTSDLFVLHAQHSPQELHLFEEMAGKLVEDADEATLTIVARKLARCIDTPASVLKKIRARGGAPESEILLVDTQIEWLELRAIAASGGVDAACAVAGRQDLDREISKILAGRPEREVARALAANASAPLAVEDLRLLCARGREDSILAKALLSRGEPGLDHLPLYLYANSDQRRKLLDLTRATSLGHIGRNEDTTELDTASCTRLEAGALRQKRSSFALTLAVVMGCDPLCARRIVDDESGEALTLAFISIGLPAEIGARIFLIAFPKVALSAEVFGANMAMFKSLPRIDAARIVAAITGEARSASASFLRAQARRAPFGGLTGAFVGNPGAVREETQLFPAVGR